MDLLQQIKAKISANPSWNGARGIESVLTHIELAERHHQRATATRDEHLYTDAIYRTNHAFEGILKEAYILLAGESADRRTPNEIEEYLLNSNTLRPRVIDQLTNYRKNWRNPSTHDYQLFFTEQESILAIVNVCAFVSILLDQMLERAAYLEKLRSLERAAVLARERIKDFDSMPTIEKVWRLLASFADHYIANFNDMSMHSRQVTNAQIVAFLERVAPELTVQQDFSLVGDPEPFLFDLVITSDGTSVAVETREPLVHDGEDEILKEAATSQLEVSLRKAGLADGVVFFLPGGTNEVPITTTSCTSWPKDLRLRVVYGEDSKVVARWEAEDEAVSLVNEE
jgi:hypothetical protein